MHPKDIKKNRWYFIDYKDEEKFLCDGSFTGEAKLVKIVESEKIEDTEYFFESPLAPDTTMWFTAENINIINECDPCPTYEELYKEWKSDETLRWMYERIGMISQPMGKAVEIEIIDGEGVGQKHTYNEDKDLKKSNFEVFKDAINELMEKYPLKEDETT